MEYDVDYFIKKFEAIPDIKWGMFCCEDKEGRHCALGHCGGINADIYLTPESVALSEILKEVVLINDNMKTEYRQSSPKQRILAALNDKRDNYISEANLKATKELIKQPSQLQEVK